MDAPEHRNGNMNMPVHSDLFNTPYIKTPKFKTNFGVFIYKEVIFLECFFVTLCIILK